MYTSEYFSFKCMFFFTFFITNILKATNIISIKKSSTIPIKNKEYSFKLFFYNILI